jgi:hypothetical protein
MYVLAIHRISNPAKFWEVLQGAGPLPPGINVHQTLPSPDGKTAVCLWEADSLQTVRGIVDGAVGQFSENELFEVDAKNAQGLPR